MPKKKEKVIVIPTVCAYHDEKDENLSNILRFILKLIHGSRILFRRTRS